MYVYVCEWGRMGHDVMIFTRRQKNQPIASAVAVWPGAIGRYEAIRQYIPPHYGRPKIMFLLSTCID
ncbi:hypothetical protein Hanom_Chr04g00358001 [Helianthus anomalus]